MISRARALRHRQTDAERLLWRFLRNRQLGDFKFRRQFLIPPYIADFACVEAGLIVEIDGSQHFARQLHDAKRSLHFERLGYRTVRYWDNDVLLKTSEVLEAILLELGRSLTPTPLPSGEGSAVKASPLTPTPLPGGEGRLELALLNSREGEGMREGRREKIPSPFGRGIG